MVTTDPNSFLQSTARRPASLREVAALAASGGIDDLLREFLDEFYVAQDEAPPAMLAEEPPLLESKRANAYLAAVAEHLSPRHSLPRLDWVSKPERFLHRDEPGSPWLQPWGGMVPSLAPCQAIHSPCRRCVDVIG